MLSFLIGLALGALAIHCHARLVIAHYQRAFREIVAHRTPHANATVRNVVKIAEDALNA